MKKFSLVALLLLCVLIFFYAVTFNVETEPKNDEEELQIEQTEIPVPTETPEGPTERELALSKIMKDTFANVTGNCQWGVYAFDDGAYIYNRSEAVPSASVIKLFIMEYTFALVERGNITLSDTIEGVEISTLLERMITVSDNSATNAFIDYYGMDKLNAFFEETGYAQTSLNRRMLDYAAMNRGVENYTSVLDVMKFLRKVYDNKEAFPYNEMLAIMKRQTVRTKLPVKLPSEVEIAHKTGELDTVENDVGIIFSEKADFAVVCLCSSLADRGDARSAISNAALSLYNKITE